MRGKGFYYKGFTLVELMVTISILAILMTIALISYGNVQRNARDGKRKADISTIQSALEQYHADQGFYPAGNTLLTATSLTNQIGLPAPTPSVVKTYLQKIPQESQSGISAYSYTAKPSSPVCDNTSTNRCTTYCLYATVENNSNATTPALTICSGAPPLSYQTQAP